MYFLLNPWILVVIIIRIENGNRKFFKEVTTQPKSRKQPMKTYGYST